VAPRDAEALAGRVAALVADPQAAREMGQAGRQHVRERFEIQRYIDELLGLYRVASMAK
jgi:D-inositol-3-phosphate glycosyltransferase